MKGERLHRTFHINTLETTIINIIFLPPRQLMAMSCVSLNTKFVDGITVVPFE